MKKNQKINEIDLQANEIEIDNHFALKNELAIQNNRPYDLKNLFTSKPKENEKELSYEKALSMALLDVIEHLHNSSEISKSESKAFAILSSCSKTMETICKRITDNKKEFKRKKEKVWKSVVNDITSAINRKENETDKGLLDNILHRNR